jgi:glycosyltransferase involved in cell wall biosynthesis
MIRVLHFTGGMVRGGVETWLMHVLRNIDRDAIQMDFFSHSGDVGTFDREIEELGGRVFRYGHSPSDVRRYRAALRRVLQETGPYDVAHSHVHQFSGYVLRVAQGAGVPIRIAHSHVAQGSRPAGRDQLWRPLYARVMRSLIRRHATAGLANSLASAEDLFGRDWRSIASILPYGFDFGPYAGLPSKPELKRRLGLDPATKVIGHVGRFHPQKNHPFLVDVFEHVRRTRTDVHLLMVGGRGNQAEIAANLDARGLGETATITGERDEIATSIGAMDLMVFPSLYEGLGIVVLEAQAAGVPTLASEGVPAEADVVPGMVERLALTAGPEAWARRVDALLDAPIEPRDYAAIMADSPYGIERCIAQLRSVYEGAVARR